MCVCACVHGCVMEVVYWLFDVCRLSGVSSSGLLCSVMNPSFPMLSSVDGAPGCVLSVIKTAREDCM